MSTDKTLKALLRITADRVRFMVGEDDARSGCPISASISPAEGNAELTVVAGRAHAVMRVIGVLADHGEGCLLSVFTTEQAEAFDAAAAYAELSTGDGARKQPAAWAMDAEGQFLPGVIAKRARAALRYQS